MPQGQPINPFEYTRPIVDAEKTMARPHAVRAIVNALYRESVVSVMGSWQTGKTGLLLSLREQFDRTVYIKSYGVPSEVLSNLQDNIDRQIPDIFTDIPMDGNDTRALVDLFHSLAKRASIVFLVDALPMPREIAYQFLSAIRIYLMESLAETSKTTHKFVIASSVDVVTLTQEMNPDLSPFNIAIPVYLEDFSDAEVRTFIQRLAPGEFSEWEMKKISEYTGGHPFLVQFVCHHLYDKPDKKREEILKNADTVVKELRLEETWNIKSMLHHIGNSQELGEAIKTLKKILRIGNILRRRRVPFSRVARHIQTLYLQGAIREDGNGYCEIRNPLYEVVLRRALPELESKIIGFYI